jgi:hypothetical protein
MRSRFDSLILGLIIGLFVPALCVIMFYYSSFTLVSFQYFLKHSMQIDVLPKLISLGAVPNLGVFFLFLWRNHYYSARGVIFATFLLAFGVVALKLFF